MNDKVAMYIRVSTFDQQKGKDSQIKALKDYCRNHGLKNVKVFTDTMTGSKIDRPQFKRLQRAIFKGEVNTVIVWKLDRLSRSLKDGINTLCQWLDKGIRVVSVTQQLDFGGAVGKMIAGILFAVAEMERENLRENTKRGLAAAKARGVKLGKRSKLFAKDIVPLLRDGLTVVQVADKLGKSRVAIYNALRREDIDIKKIRA